MSKLEIKDLTKTYPSGIIALKEVSVSIGKGMFGLLGPNGAGKTTLMRILATLQTPDSGTVNFGNLDVLKEPMEMRKSLGYLPQEFGVYPSVSAEQLLAHIAVLKGVFNKKERIEQVSYLLNKVNLADVRKKEVKSFSGGMKQRFGIAQALLGKPELIIVDEPTAGLDPGERNRFYNLLSDIGQEIVIILSTHIVEDVNEMCTDMAIIKAGELVYNGSPQSALISLNDKIWELTVPRSQADELSRQYTVLSCRFLAGKALLHVLSDVQPQLMATKVLPNLEDAYFKLINS